MNIGRQRIVLFFILLLMAVAAGIALKEAVIPKIIRRRLISAVHKSCATCELSLSRLHLSLMPPALRGSDVSFSGGTPNATVVHAEAERVYVPFSLFPLFSSHLRLGRIEIEQAAVEVTEGDLSAPASAENSKEGAFDLEIEGVKIRKASFTYVREYPGRKGILGISRINADVGPAGSSARIRDNAVEASADGLLEGSGQFRLEVRAKIFERVPNVGVKLHITGQKLANLNRFFKPNDGIKLQGVLIEGRSSVLVRGRRLNANDYVRFRGFSVKIKQNKERGALSAFFQTFLASLKMGKQNVDGGNYDRSGTADLERRPKETLISFILRGMKEAAIKVAGQGGN